MDETKKNEDNCKKTEEKTKKQNNGKNDYR